MSLTHYVVQAGLELVILLPQLSEAAPSGLFFGEHSTFPFSLHPAISVLILTEFPRPIPSVFLGESPYL